MGKTAKIRKFRNEWLLEEWAKGWLKKAEEGSSFNEAFCKVCKQCLRAHKSDLIRHGKKPCHLQKMRLLVTATSSQLRLENMLIIKDDVKEKELCFALFTAMHSSIKSIDHLGEIFNISANSSIRLHRTKCTALIKKVLAPTFQEELLEDIGNKPYSLIVDESTDVSTKKYMCLCVRYFSDKEKAVQNCFLGLIEVEKASAKELFKAVTEFLNNQRLEINNLIGLGTDGANNLCGKNNSLFSLIKGICPNVQLVRCICHSLNLASSAAACSLPSNLDFLCKEIYSWFNASPLRRIEYQRLYEIINNNEKKFHNFVQLSGTRWLCRYNVIRVIIEHYEELKLHFNVVVNKEKCYTSKVLNEMLNDISNYLYLLILEPIFKELNKLNLIFQKENIEVGSAADDIKNIIMFIAQKIYKPLFFSQGFDNVCSAYDNAFAYLSLEKIDFGVNFNKTVERLLIRGDVFGAVQVRAGQFMKVLLGELLNRLPDNLTHFSKLKAFSPKMCLSHVIRYKFSDLPFVNIFCAKEDISTLENQYHILLNVNWGEMYGTHIFENSNTFWPIVAQHTTADGELAFKELSNFVLLLLSLPTSNATVERMFSLMNIVKTKLRNRMQIELLSSLLTIKSTFYNKHICCTKFKPSRTMFQKFNNSIYNVTPETETEQTDNHEIYQLVDKDYNIPCISIL